MREKNEWKKMITFKARKWNKNACREVFFKVKGKSCQVALKTRDYVSVCTEEGLTLKSNECHTHN